MGRVSIGGGGSSSPTEEKIEIHVGESSSTAVGFNHLVKNFNDGITTSLFFNTTVPANWDSSQNPTITAKGICDSTGSSQDYEFEWGLLFTTTGDVLSLTEDETITFTQAAPDPDQEVLVTDSKEIDKANITAGDNMGIIFRRLGGDANDTRVGTFFTLMIEITFPLS